MILPRRASLSLALVLLSPTLTAGVLTVGPAGSGAQFTQIQAAIDAAADNDVILVRPGTYQRITVDKPLRILGDGTGVVAIGASGSGVLAHDIGPGEEFVLSGVEVRDDFFTSNLILLQDCPGTVVLQDVTAQGEGTGIRIESCARVLLARGRILAGEPEHLEFREPAVFAQDSELWIVDSEITGASDGSFHGGLQADGVEIAGSTLRVWRSRIRGGGELGVQTNKSGSPGGVGIKAAHSVLDLFGGPGSEILGGNGPYEVLGPENYPGGPGIHLLQDSHARIQADVLILGGLDGRELRRALPVRADGASTFVLDPRIFPTLASSTQQTQLGASFTLDLQGNPGAFQVLYLSLRTGPTKTYAGTQGFGLLVLDRTQLFTLAGEVLPASSHLTVGVRVPNTASLLGATLFFQAAERFAGGYAISNPALVTITR